jgi:hypothetical protein
MSEKTRREAHGGADPYADVIQLVRSQIVGDKDLHAELITPYWGHWKRMYGLFTSAEAFARHLVTELAAANGETPADYLRDFALRYAQLPPDEPPNSESE